MGDKTCADAFLAAEAKARAARRGLWADPNFAPLAAENWRRLQGERVNFTLVEGKVLSVRDSGTINVNFGQRWARDFSVIIILHRDARSFAAAGFKPHALTGRRVRGWLEQRRGPIIEADAPEQIELIGAAAGQSQETR